jgi:diaminopimelate epimerase
MRFIKMHALGNDYVYIDCIREKLEVTPELIRRMSRFHTGIGSDGVILILPSDKAVARMRMFNPDGTEGEMCGNGLRCIAKYVYEAGYAPGEEFDLDTVPGIRHQWVKVRMARSMK